MNYTVINVYNNIYICKHIILLFHIYIIYCLHILANNFLIIKLYNLHGR